MRGFVRYLNGLRAQKSSLRPPPVRMAPELRNLRPGPIVPDDQRAVLRRRDEHVN